MLQDENDVPVRIVSDSAYIVLVTPPVAVLGAARPSPTSLAIFGCVFFFFFLEAARGHRYASQLIMIGSRGHRVTLERYIGRMRLRHGSEDCYY